MSPRSPVGIDGRHRLRDVGKCQCHTIVVSVRDLIILVLGAVLGVLAQQTYDWLNEHYRHRLEGRRADRLRGPNARSALRRQTMQFYQKRGLRDVLYTPDELGINKQIPILPSDMVIPHAVDLYDDGLFYLDGSRSNFPVNRRLIRRSLRAGANIFDGEILFVEKVYIEANTIKKIELRRCSFFQFASLSLKLQEALRARWHRNAQHEQHFASFQAAITRPLQPQVLGCTCVTLFEDGGEILVALANRSQEVMNESSVKSALPSFGVEPNVVGHERSHYSLIFYNYFKEFAEEFFDVDELVEAAKARRAHPDWILQLPAVEAITREARGGRLSIQYLGMAIGPADGSFKCALLVWFHSSAFYRKLQKDLRANWESSRGEGNQPSVQFVPLFSPLIDEWADNEELGATSAFAIDMARKLIKKTRRTAVDAPTEPTL
jgi:hypothetical protein